MSCNKNFTERTFLLSDDVNTTTWPNALRRGSESPSAEWSEGERIFIHRYFHLCFSGRLFLPVFFIERSIGAHRALPLFLHPRRGKHWQRVPRFVFFFSFKKYVVSHFILIKCSALRNKRDAHYLFKFQQKRIAMSARWKAKRNREKDK